ncbi:ATP-dependent RNA helicase DBP3 [Pyrenophora tritici-repentis]|nr:ATP-dependent RNA helicase DBP3 [Pyrenophora tritici-repentis]
MVGVAETGSGKTLAFEKRKGIKAVIVSPTRELAVQIYDQLVALATPAGLSVVCVYGGVPKDPQVAACRKAHIVVATPGRLNDLIGEGSADLSKAEYVVLDEADRMLDKGFEEAIRKIISQTPKKRQTLMFTATWPPSVRDLASTFMNSPVKITIGDNQSGELRANVRIKQVVEVVDPVPRSSVFFSCFKQYQSGKNKDDRILVFCLYKKEAVRIENFIRMKGFRVGGIHGDLSQEKRSASLAAFKEGHVPLLVATDVAARGLDIPAVKVVINVTFPLTAEDYVHRIGRTGRAGKEGLAITLFTDHDKALSGSLINVLKAANQPVPEELMKFGTTVKKKEHGAYGAFYKTRKTPKQRPRLLLTRSHLLDSIVPYFGIFREKQEHFSSGGVSVMQKQNFQPPAPRTTVTMATVNIRRDVTDPFYRYKMERIQSRLKAKYFGFELGAQTNTSPNDDRWIINGAHDASKLQDYLDGFISKFVLCKKCKNPETDVHIKDANITLDCKACGKISDVDPRLKLSSFILKNEPKKGKKDKSSKKASVVPARRPRLENGDDGDLALEAGSDDELTRQINEGAKEIEDEDAKEVEWSIDTSEAAIRARAQDLPDDLKRALVIEDEDEGGSSYDTFGKWIIDTGAEKGGVENLDNVDIYVKAKELGIETKHRTLTVIPQTLFTEKIHEKAFLGGIERFVGNDKPELIPQVSAILLKIYENDLVSEEQLKAWCSKASKRYVDLKVSKTVRKSAEQFKTWLETADSDEEDDSD